MITALTIVSLVAAASTLLSQTSPYSGEQARDIKALSAVEIQSYLSGSGMGYAKAAELNHYPGPKHVLELATQLQLTEKQMAEARQAFKQMNERAVELGKSIVEQEEYLNRRFAHNQIDENILSEITGQIAELQGKLRAVHLTAHLAMRETLTEKQIQRYDELRGYSAGGKQPPQDHQHKQ